MVFTNKYCDSSQFPMKISKNISFSVKDRDSLLNYRKGTIVEGVL